MSDNIILRNLVPRPIKGLEHPFVDTRPVYRTGIRGIAQTLFFENFDDQPDWHSAMYSTDTVQRASTHTIPNNWFSIRQEPLWAPSTGHNDRMENVSILASNSDKARNGTGKSAVFTRDSSPEPSWFWNSDGAMVLVFPEDHQEIYAEFWIRFSPNWTTDLDSDSKIFRISSWNRTPSEYTAFDGGNLGPIAIWNWAKNEYGVRNKTTLRGGPHGDNYTFAMGSIANYQGSSNFTSHTVGMGVNDTTPQITDQINGGFLSDNLNQTVEHAQVFGESEHWTKMGFYVKMNSEVDATDGIFRQWLNDEQIMNITTIPWIRASDQNTAIGWNLVEIGGNDFFKVYPDEDRRQEWYAIDDLLILDGLPEDKK